MSSRPHPDPDGERPSWMGAPGYQPHVELPPHAPMPGAPPYPAAVDHPPPPVGQQPAPGTPYGVVLGACAVAAVLNVVLVLVFGPLTPVTAVLVPLAVALVTAMALWLVVRRRRLAFGSLLLVAVPAYFVVRALATLVPV